MPVAIGALEGPLWPSLAVRDLRLGDAAEPLLAARHAELRFGALALGDVPQLTLDRVAVAGARVALARDAQGRWPWQRDDEAPEPDAAPGFVVRIGSVALQDTRVVLSEDGRALRVTGDAAGRGVRIGGGVAVDALDAQLSVATRQETEGASWEEWARVRLAGGFEDERWEVREARIEGDVVQGEARGAGDAHGLADAEIRFDVPSLAALSERLPGLLPDAAGQVAGSASLRGPWNGLVGTLRADGADVSVQDLDMGSVSLHVESTQPGELWLEALRIDGADLGLRATQRARFHTGEAVLTVDGLALAMRDGSTLAVDAQLPYATLGKPRSLLERGPAARLRMLAQGWPLGVLSPLLPARDVALRGTLDADLVFARAAGARPTLRGHLTLEDGAVETPDLAIAAITLAVDVEGDPDDPRGRARGRLGGVVRGDLALGDVTFALRGAGRRVVVVDELTVEGGRVPLALAAGSRFAIGEERVTLEDVRVSSAGQTVALDGTVGRDGSCDLRATAEALDVAVLARLARPGDGDRDEPAVPVAGRLGADLRCAGPFAAPRLDGTLTWSAARIDVFDFERIDARLHAADGTQHLDSAWIHDGEVLLEVAAEAPVARLTDPEALLADPALVVRAEARAIDLAVLRPFLPEATPALRGPIRGAVTLRGGSPSPGLSGRLAVRGGSMEVTPLRNPLAPIDLTVSLDEDVLTLEALRIGAPGAGATGSGRIQLAGNGDGALAARLDLDALRLDVPGLVSGRVNGRLDLTGQVSAPDLRGELALAGLEVTLPEERSPELKEIQILTTGNGRPALEVQEVPEAPSWIDPLAMDVAVDVPRNSWVRGRGAEVEITGDLRVRKARGRDPRLSGEIQTLRGRYDAYGRRFQVQRGRAILDGSWPPDPLLEIRGERRIRDVTIIAVLEGRLSEPRLRLDSDPPMNETDIASYLVFGRSASDLGAGEQQAAGAVAGRIAAGMAVRELEQIFQGRLPVDVIDLQIEENEGRSELGLGFGKYIGDRLFLRYQRTFGETPVDEVRGELELTPNWSLEASAAGDGTTGADLIFRFDY